MKQGFQNAGQKMKEGLQKAGTWIKDNGAKVAKFGLKAVSTAASVAGHIVSLLPGVGKIVGKSLSAVSKLTDFASDKIRADLGDKLNKSMNILDKIEHPLSEYMFWFSPGCSNVLGVCRWRSCEGFRRCFET
jgi:hypothetical protein